LFELDFRRTPVTLILLVIIAGLEIVCTVDPDRRHFYYMKLGVLSTVWRGEVWRPFTTTLLHGDLFHAGFNAYWLALFGGALERWLGSYRTLAVLVLLAYTSMLPEFLVANWDRAPDEQVPIVGFSGVVYGLFGLIQVGRRYRSELAAVLSDQTVYLLIGWFFFCIVATWFDVMPVANFAHGAGWAFGAMFGMALFPTRRRALWTAGTAIVAVVILATMIGLPFHPLYRKTHGRRVFYFSATHVNDTHGGLLVAKGERTDSGIPSPLGRGPEAARLC